MIDITHILKRVKTKDFVEDPLYFFSDGYWDRPMARLFCLQTNRVRRDVRKAYADADALSAQGNFGGAHTLIEWAKATQALCLPEGNAADFDAVVDDSLTPEYLSECGKRYGFLGV